jgi:hypothetical protein
MHWRMRPHCIRALGLGLSVIGVVCSTMGACNSDDPAAAPRGSSTALVGGPAAAPPARELTDAMASFARALRESDREAFLRSFSQGALWNAINTKSQTMTPSRVSYEKLSDALNTEGLLRASLMGDGESSLRTYVTGAYAKDWTPLNQYQFAPAGVSHGSVWIAWRPEGDRWVVDTIAWPIR